MNCPACHATIANENINIQTDIARCGNCNYIFKISENLSTADPTFDMNDAPSGAWIEKGFNEITVGATTRSPVAFFLVPFMLIWSGGSLGGIYGSQLITGKFNPFMSLFGIPFIIGSVIFWTIALMAIWGKVVIVADSEGGEVFTGLGNTGIRKRFRWQDVSVIREDRATLRYPGSKGRQILIEGKNRIAFGSGLNTERSYYLLKSLQQLQSQYSKKVKL